MRPHCLSFLRALALAGALFLAGCAGVERAAPHASGAAVEAADALYRMGDFDAAADAYVAEAARNRALRDLLLLKAAESQRQENGWDRVEALLDQIHLRRLTAEEAEHFNVLRAEAAQAQGRNDEAIALTDETGHFAPRWRGRTLETRARALAASDQFIDAARARLELDTMLEGYERSQNQAQLVRTLGRMDAAELAEAAARLPFGDPLEPWVAQVLGSKGSALPLSLPQLDRQVGTVLADAAREGHAPPRHVALILPLGGALAPAAGAVRDGFFTAQQTDPEGGAMRVDVIDAGETVASTLMAYQQALDMRVDIAIGPLASDAVQALFQRHELPLRVLALNRPDEGLPPPGSAEFALPPEAEAAQSAERMRAQGLTTALVFAAQTSWAERAERAFRAQFQSLGGQVIGSATLDRSQVNYAATIDALFAHADAATGVFIALGPEQGRLLVPQLRIARVAQPLFATSHIYAAEENPGLDRDMDGLVFSDAPWLFGALPGLPRRADLATSMATTLGPAARLFAFGMDAYALLPYLDWLRAHPESYLAGATGQLSMDAWGRITRTPSWFKFVNGIAVPASSLALDAPTTH